MRSIGIATLFLIIQAVSYSAASLSVTSPTWSAAIYHISAGNSSYKCSGTLINSNTILTAAQCVFENNQQIFPRQLLIQLGKYKLKVFGPNTKAFQVHEIIPHPNYDSSNFDNDIAIIRLSTEAIPSDDVQPVCLWESNRTPLSEVINKLGTVSGWEVSKTDFFSINLQEDLMPVVSIPTCLRSNRNFFGNYLSDTNFCAGFGNGSSACNLDAGGSMTFEENGVDRIRGIVSTSATRQYKICSTEYVIFTDVAQYLTWIHDVVPQLQCSDNSVLATPTITTIYPRVQGQVYQGCYRDKSERAYFKVRLPYGTNTVYSCAMKCYEHQFKYTGTEYGIDCFCGNTLPNPVKHPLLEDSHCNRKCRGNRSEICGGRWALSVYTTGL